MTRPNAFFGDVASSLIGFFRREFKHLPVLPDCFWAFLGNAWAWIGLSLLRMHAYL